jgi:hypothetical protein
MIKHTKNTSMKLDLRTETIRVLQDAQLGTVVAGMPSQSIGNPTAHTSYAYCCTK